MSLVNVENQKKIASIVGEVTTFADIVDNPGVCDHVPGLGCEPGLGMHTEAESFRAMSEDIKEGVFKTLVMGKFKNGKSTFINALIGKLLMAAKATACTAVIATVSFGEDNNTVYVYYKDREMPREMTLEDFTKEFQLTDADQDAIENGEKFDKFASVSHVEMHSDDKMFADGVRLIDSPGLEEANSRTITTTEFVPKANAIIFTLSATSLFSDKEKQYIAMNFAGKHMRNVFFVVNRINQLNGANELEDTVKPSVRHNLEDVFTDENGYFDEALYKSRVFYVDAYGALCASTNQPYKVLVGRKEIEAPITKEETGMVEFEKALTEFLNSPDRLHATFSSTMTGMANTYQSAVNKVNADKAVRQTSKEERVRRSKEAEKELKKAQQQVDDIRATVKKSGELISQKLYNDLVGYVQTEIPRTYASYVSSKEGKPKFGMGDMLKLAGATIGQSLGSKESKEKWAKKNQAILMPLVNYVNDYIKNSIEAWGKRVPTLISKDTRDLQASLEDQSKEFDLSLDRAVNLFAYGNATAPTQSGSGIKAGLQSVLALSNWDVSLAVEGTAKGGMSWGEFAKRVGVQMALDFAVSLIFGAPLLIPALIIEVFSLKYHAGQTSDQLLTAIGTRAFDELGKKIAESELTFKEDINKQFTEMGEKTATTALSLLKDAKANMDRLVNEDTQDTAAAEAENARVDANLKAMHDCIDTVYAELYGHKPSEREFANLSRNEAKK